MTSVRRLQLPGPSSAQHLQNHERFTWEGITAAFQHRSSSWHTNEDARGTHLGIHRKRVSHGGRGADSSRTRTTQRTGFATDVRQTYQGLHRKGAFHGGREADISRTRTTQGPGFTTGVRQTYRGLHRKGGFHGGREAGSSRTRTTQGTGFTMCVRQTYQGLHRKRVFTEGVSRQLEHEDYTMHG
jgi:hypothetical protein